MSLHREDAPGGFVRTRSDRLSINSKGFDLYTAAAISMAMPNGLVLPSPQDNMLQESTFLVTSTSMSGTGIDHGKEATLADSRSLEGGGLDRFLNWMQVNGADFRGCYVKRCTDEEHQGYGLFASSDCTEGVLLVTPLSIAITPVTILQDPLLGAEYMKLFENREVDDRLLIMIFLLVERGRGQYSFWEPYLNTFPTRFGSPVCFTEEELLELQGTALFSATRAQLNSLRTTFDGKVKPLVERFLSLAGIFNWTTTYEDFLWTNCIFWSRALSIPCPHSYVFPALPSQSGALSPHQRLIPSTHSALETTPPVHSLDGGPQLMERQGEEVVHPPETDSEWAHKEISNGSAHVETNSYSGGHDGQEDAVCVEGLVPGVDFCNHEPKAAALWEVDDPAGSATGIPCSMYLVTLPNYTYHSDAEIRIKYGSKGNEELLFLYGFVLEDNPDDFIMVHYPRQALLQSACSEAKLQLLQGQDLELRWLLSVSLLKKGFLSQTQNGPPSSTTDMEPVQKQISCGYSWSGNRQPPRELDRIVFPEPVIAALRTVAMTEAEFHATVALLDELTGAGRLRQPTKEDISAAVWEVCGDAGGYLLLIDLLTSLKLGLVQGTGTRQMDAQLLEKDQIARAKLKQAGHFRTEELRSIEKDLLTQNKRSCVIYRMGQKQLAELFLAAAEEALAVCGD